MKIFQQIIAILCLFAAGLILTAAICGAGGLSQACIDKAVNIKNFKVYVERSDKYNAAVHRTQRYLRITDTLKDFLDNDELCSVVLHENAHIALRHNDSTHYNEFKADSLAAIHMRSLKLDPMTGCYALVKVAEQVGLNLDAASDTHPSINDRCENIARTIRGQYTRR